MPQEQAATADVLTPEQEEQTARERQRKPKRQPRYHVILWDDPNHTFDYVIVMLQELFAHPVPKGFELAETVHNRGRAIVLTTTLEHAELKRDQIKAYGSGDIKLASKGSMHATIEPESGG